MRKPTWRRRKAKRKHLDGTCQQESDFVLQCCRCVLIVSRHVGLLSCECWFDVRPSVESIREMRIRTEAARYSHGNHLFRYVSLCLIVDWSTICINRDFPTTQYCSHKSEGPLNKTNMAQSKENQDSTKDWRRTPIKAKHRLTPEPRKTDRERKESDDTELALLYSPFTISFLQILRHSFNIGTLTMSVPLPLLPSQQLLQRCLFQAHIQLYST